MWSRVATAALALALGSLGAHGESWVRLGNSAIDLSLAGLATGAVSRVWYSLSGDSVFIQTQSGKVFESKDFETWRASTAVAPTEANLNLAKTPETGAKLRGAVGQSGAAYGFGTFVYRSADAGASWDNLTAVKVPGGLASMVGTGLTDLAVSPKDPDEIVVAGADGVFRSLDGGKSWVGLNDALPNLPTARIRALPAGDKSLTLDVSGDVSGARSIEWVPGEKVAWRPVSSPDTLKDLVTRQALSLTRGATITAIAHSGDTFYTGTIDGYISVSTNAGVSWQTFSTNSGEPVTSFWIDEQDSRIALATLGARPSPVTGAPPTHVWRTLNAGTFWDDLTTTLPDSAATGVTADPQSGAIYVSTAAGVFATDLNVASGAQPTGWRALTGLPSGSVNDVKLDAGKNRLWVSVDGLGVYSTLAPHRLRDPRVVSSADLVARAAAPGALLTVLGARVDSARSGDQLAPVLASADTESQIQIPFNTIGAAVALSLASAGGTRVMPSIPITPTSPAIFLNQDNSPVVLDADTGLMLDAMNPAHSRSHIQVLTTGLGQVTPDWPTGLAAPMDNPPKVVAPVKAWLDRAPVEVTRAVLAPGLVGFYLIDLEVPKIVNYGPAELYIEAGGQASNRVRVYIEP
jgi:uncharacterized protein (TIGR03437 family)